MMRMPMPPARGPEDDEPSVKMLSARSSRMTGRGFALIAQAYEAHPRRRPGFWGSGRPAEVRLSRSASHWFCIDDGDCDAAPGTPNEASAQLARPSAKPDRVLAGESGDAGHVWR